jgi:PPOX class probable F420-dependent enzyme
MEPISPAADSFLRERPTVTLGTLMSDGSPQASVLWYLWDGSEFAMSTIHSTAKWRNLQRDPRCSLVVEEPESGQMVVAYGKARLDDGDVRSKTHEIVDKYYDDPAETAAHMNRIFAPGDRVLILVSPSRLLTRKLE